MIQRQGREFSSWLNAVFEGRFDQARSDLLLRVGAAHVRARVPQHFIVTAIEVVWRELDRVIRRADPPGVTEKLASLHKLLMLELAIMLESYKEAHSELVRKSERTAVAEKLTRAEHLGRIGQLAASLAHEIKNPLAGISGAIQIIRDAMSPDDPHQPIVTEILGQIKRLDATVKDLLMYARPTPRQAAEFPLGEVVTRALKVLREEPALQRVRVEYMPVPDHATVLADDRQLEQLIINLLINAAHASDDGGVINVAVTPDTDRISLTVEDTGRGMTPEVRDQAFEPFFTTKAKGTGLGLSICRRIVEAHGGSIELESAVDVGTVVTVILPRASNPNQPVKRE